MRPRRLVKASYGRVVLLKRYCPDCGMYAFIVDNKFQCCDRLAKDWDQEFRVRSKRESETPGRRDSLSPKEKAAILRHQLHQCVYCGQPFGRRARIEFDHFVPFAYSQNNETLNMVASCRECNHIKNSLLFSSIEEARRKISLETMSREIGISSRTLFRWLHSQHKPSLIACNLIDEYLANQEKAAELKEKISAEGA